MRRAPATGIELDDDSARVDIDAVHDFLANHSYWAEGRDGETVERLVRAAQRVVVGLATGNPLRVLALTPSDAEHAVAGTAYRDPGELFDVDVDKLAGMAPLIPIRRLKRLQPRAFAETDPLQPQRDSRER